MKKPKTDAYRPNYILATMLVMGFCIIILCGQSLWIPASRIENLYARSVALALTDTASAFASSTGFDRFVPEARQSFLDMSGLSGMTAWDTRYFNKRSKGESRSAVKPPESLPSAAAESPTIPQSLPESLSASVESSKALPVTAAEIEELLKLPPAPPAPLPASRMHSSENPLKIYMFGDSQVFSLGSGLSRLAGKGSPVDIEFLAIHSSGFIRGDYYNWPTKLADTFQAAHYDGAVMMLGMNDYQSFWDDNGVIMKKHTPAWEAAYKEKCRNIIDIVLSSVPRLYWVGMPVVKNREYNESLAYIDSVQESLAQEYSPDTLVRISLHQLNPAGNNAYVDSLDVGGGRMLKVMSGDGTHFTVEGGQLVMEGLFARFAGDYLFTQVPVANLP